MRNSSLVDRPCAENVPGLKQFTEAVDTFIGMVGERSMCDEGVP